ncbi:hypothetical protein [Streptomyces arenae]|uniref:hypothetical protein n=1 Tax=Streptomyces arenae TaxID=29301 RepID=UPI0026594FA7|nr:hypothetical protein [Streptomyces arenae]MCG7211140.1 hypothetical protein [Streptomyces arenae]
MEGEAAYGFIVNVDAQGSGLLTDTEKPEMRRRLYDVTGTAFEQAGIRPPRLYQEDRGDGILGVLAPDVPPVRVVGEWIQQLHQNLRETNQHLRKPLRLRVGLHIGRVTADAHGRSGRAVDLACRLADCAVTKAILRAADGAPLVVAASDRVHEDFILPGGRWVDPGHYRRHDVDLKEGRTTAWFMVPGRSEPPEPGPEGGQALDATAAGPQPPRQPPPHTDEAGATTEAAPAAPAAGDRVVQNIHQHGTGRIVVGGTIDTINFSDGGGR